MDPQTKFLVVASGFLAAILFALVASSERSVWASILFHICLNGVPSVIYFVSPQAEGDLAFAPAYYLMETDNVWLTGGEYSLLSSITAMVLYLAAIYYYYKKLRQDGRSLLDTNI